MFCLAFAGRGPAQVTGNESDIQPASQQPRWIDNILPTPPAVTARRLMAERQQQRESALKDWPSSLMDKVGLVIRNKHSWKQDSDVVAVDAFITLLRRIICFPVLYFSHICLCKPHVAPFIQCCIMTIFESHPFIAIQQCHFCKIQRKIFKLRVKDDIWITTLVRCNELTKSWKWCETATVGRSIDGLRSDYLNRFTSSSAIAGLLSPQFFFYFHPASITEIGE